MQSNIARLLLDKQAVKVQTDPPFMWTSGIQSPIYCDNRALVSFPDARNEIVDVFLTVIREQNLECDMIAGVATGAIAWGMLVADRLNKPFCYVRPEPRSHGTGKQVEGFVEKGQKIIVIEDLFSTAGSSVKAVEALRKEVDAEVVGIIAISTYQLEKARARLEEANVRWWTLTNFGALVAELDLPDEQKQLIGEFSKDPAGWWETFQSKQN